MGVPGASYRSTWYTLLAGLVSCPSRQVKRKPRRARRAHRKNLRGTWKAFTLVLLESGFAVSTDNTECYGPWSLHQSNSTSNVPSQHFQPFLLARLALEKCYRSFPAVNWTILSSQLVYSQLSTCLSRLSHTMMKSGNLNTQCAIVPKP